MPRRQYRRHSLAIGVVGLLLLAGCIVPTGGNLDPDSVSENVQDRYDRIDSYETTVTKTVETPTETASVRARVAVEPGEKMQITYRNGAQAGAVETIDLSAESSGQPTLSTGLERARNGQHASYGALAGTLVETNNVTVERRTTIDGQRVAVISLVPDADATAASVERTLWIDTERQLPLRVETTWTDADGRVVTETIEYANTTVDEIGGTQSTGAASPIASGAGA
ncbi:outer membrane lipoprotein-sorting protein [Halobellus rufus]|uniref:outer membrane lipoprotein-sorting protein n=1 Tax=Halobellus rufus TaxID=1448860 RepID=UPI0012E094B3|nr:outer membrane lipoprotein-sorting protein [Halobellus rufus]